MDTVEKQLLLRDLERYGYHLAHSDSAEPAHVLQRMVSSDDGRVLEGVPVVLSNILLAKELDLEAVELSLPAALQKRFRILSAVTHHFMFWVPDSDGARKLLQRYLKKREPALLESVADKLRNHDRLPIGAGLVLDVERLEKTYQNYVLERFTESQSSVSKKLEEQRSTMLNEAMSQLFTDKQKELILKVLNHESLSKTEREYYSRIVKPRLKALRNPDLQTMAATLLGY